MEQSAMRHAGLGVAIIFIVAAAFTVSHDRPTAMSTSDIVVQEPECVWGYTGEHGPADWGTMCQEKYPLCSNGTTQSPIDVTSWNVVTYTQKFLQLERWSPETLSWDIPPASMEPRISPIDVSPLELFNGHTYEVEHIRASLTFGGTKYNLKQFHMHTESEHTFDGRHYDLEMHFVHVAPGMEKDGTDKVMVVACFFQVVEDTTSPQFFRDLANGVSSVSPPPGAPTVPLNFKDMAQHILVGSISTTGEQAADFKPNFENYLAYTGSFTTPPCSEGVQWVILRNPVLVSAEDVEKIKNLEGRNFRPTQPLNGRSVYWVRKE